MAGIVRRLVILFLFALDASCFTPVQPGTSYGRSPVVTRAASLPVHRRMWQRSTTATTTMAAATARTAPQIYVYPPSAVSSAVGSAVTSAATRVAATLHNVFAAAQRGTVRDTFLQRWQPQEPADDGGSSGFGGLLSTVSSFSSLSRTIWQRVARGVITALTLEQQGLDVRFPGGVQLWRGCVRSATMTASRLVFREVTVSKARFEVRRVFDGVGAERLRSPRDRARLVPPPPAPPDAASRPAAPAAVAAAALRGAACARSFARQGRDDARRRDGVAACPARALPDDRARSPEAVRATDARAVRRGAALFF